LSYLANRQTDKQTKTGKNIISLAEVMKNTRKPPDLRLKTYKLPADRSSRSSAVTALTIWNNVPLDSTSVYSVYCFQYDLITFFYNLALNRLVSTTPLARETQQVFPLTLYAIQIHLLTYLLTKSTVTHV